MPSVPAELTVPELRDYRRINADLARLLDSGETLVRLTGVEGQRLLLHELSGTWDGVVELHGWAGPELAAEMEAPNLRVVCFGRAAEGAGRGLRAGALLITGAAGDAVAYAQRGGVIVVAGAAGARAGLNLAGGVLALLGPSGRLAGERQSGGRIFARSDALGPHAGRGRRGGTFSRILPANDENDSQETFDLAAATLDWSAWLDPAVPPHWRLVDA